MPLVVDGADGCEPGAKLLPDDAVGALVSSLFPLATVVTPNLPEAESLAGSQESGESWLSGSMRSRFCVIVTGGHGDEAVDHLFDGREHIEIPVDRCRSVRATHGAGCTHSAVLTVRLARGDTLEEAAIFAAAATSQAVEHGLDASIGAGDGPVDVFNLTAAR